MMSMFFYLKLLLNNLYHLIQYTCQISNNSHTHLINNTIQKQKTKKHCVCVDINVENIHNAQYLYLTKHIR